MDIKCIEKSFIGNLTTSEAVEPVSAGLIRRVSLLEDYFFNHKNLVAVATPRYKVTPATTDDLRAALLAHVAGKMVPGVEVNIKGEIHTGHYRIGSYSPDHAGNTKFTCLDFDGPGHKHPLKSPINAALQVMGILSSHGISHYLERSGGGKGYHIWIFFAHPVPAEAVRKMLFEMMPRDIELESGELANCRSNKGIEVFPKQDRIGEKGYGNLIWLPWWHMAPKGANEFLLCQDGDANGI